MDNIQAGDNWCERIENTMSPYRGQEISTGEIISAVRKAYPGANGGNVLPADHCAGRLVKVACPYCQDSNRTIFRQLSRGKYLVLGGQSIKKPMALEPGTLSRSVPPKPNRPSVVPLDVGPPIAVPIPKDLTNTAWINLGSIKAKAGARFAFSHVPDQPALYKLTFVLWGKTYAYIGETGRLRGRIGEYARTPT